jgi:superoxide dismutase, Fe-Mn family
MMTANGEKPLVQNARPILGCDDREHAYYIDYHNCGADYLKAFLDHPAKWEYVTEMFAAVNK